MDRIKIPGSRSLQRSTLSIIGSIAALLFSYVLIRAYLLAFTWDESYTFLTYVKNNIWFLDQHEQMSANHHLLNTWLMRLSYLLLGDSELALRLPNVVSYLIFLYFSARICLSFSPAFLSVCSFILLNANPFLLDFFSLARGYGLSMGLMMGSLYFIFAFTKKNKGIPAVLFHLLFSSLAVLASFSLLNYFLVTNGILLLALLFPGLKKEKGQRTAPLLNIIFIMLASAALLYIVLPIIFKLKEIGALFYGMPHGFWPVTVGTLVSSVLYQMPYAEILSFYVKLFILFVLFFAVFAGGYKLLVKKEKWESSFLIVMILVLAGMITSVIVQHIVFDTLYLMTRTALLFIPVFMLVLIFTIKEMQNRTGIMYASLCIITTAFSFHFLASANTYYVLEWKVNADVKTALNTIDKNRTINGKGNVRVGMDFLFEPEFDYYRDARGLDWLTFEVIDSGMTKLYDYYLFSPTPASQFMKKYPRMKILEKYPVTGNVLFRD